MVRFVRDFMSQSSKTKAAVTVGMLVGGFVVIFILTKLIGMLTKTLGKDNSFQGAPSSLPKRERVQPSMARTSRRRRLRPPRG